MAQKKLDTFQMKTRFEGLIKLLAEGLYSVPDIFVRELIQNAHDSIVRRKAVEPDLAGRIDVQYNTVDRTISFTDNGIGMDIQDIREFLSVIGSTGTGLARTEGGKLAYELIGQFGIGMLSAFVVADKVYVDTKKMENDNAFQWRNAGSEDCELYSSNYHTTGSMVTVFLRANYTYYLSEAKLREIIIRYCDFISFPIYLNGLGPINSITAPWNRTYVTTDAEHDAYYDFINRRFSDISLDVFPFEFKEPYQARGILYISDRRVADINTGGLLDIFVRNMLVKQADASLLPHWAKFVRGVIDSPDLKPTAARDNIQTTDPSFITLQQKLGEAIVERLKYLAKSQPKRFETINEWHHYHLKGMALYDDSFFRAVSDLLLYDTNKGKMTLKDYLPKNDALPSGKAPIYFFSYHDSAAQYFRMADAKGLTVIDAGDRFDEEVLKKYAGENSSKVELTQFDVMSDGILFEPISKEDALRYQELEQRFTYMLTLHGLNVRVDVKRFLPADIPAVIVESPRTKAEEDLHAFLTNPQIRMGIEDTWDEVLKTQRRKTRLLALNVGHPLIDGLTAVADNYLLEKTMLSIYNNAMLYAHRMDPENMTIVHQSMVSMMESAVEGYRQCQEMEKKLEESREWNLNQRTDWERPDHIRVFLITPYAEEYKKVERALRRVLEDAPYFFEVRLARDYTHSGGGLVDDLQKHIGESHAFFADITGLNPNVMMEVGAIRLTRDPRPLLVLKTDEQKTDRLGDLGDKLWISYGSLDDSEEDIRSRIQDSLYQDGEFRREDIQSLLRQQKQRYLAVSLLKDLDIKLNDAQIGTIRQHYTTVEALLTVDAKTLEHTLRMDDWQVKGLQSQLKKRIGQ